MCSRKDRWGSRPSFEVPAKEPPPHPSPPVGYCVSLSEPLSLLPTVSPPRRLSSPPLPPSMTRWAVAGAARPLPCTSLWEGGGGGRKKESRSLQMFTHLAWWRDSEKQPQDYVTEQTRVQEIWFMRGNKKQEKKNCISTLWPRRSSS